jgi:pimeloyl-ACP methyl ester carboxylesterase
LHTSLLVDAHAIEVASWGPPVSSCAPIVLLHEGLGSVAMWRGFPAAVAQRTGCRVMAYSRYGHGASDPPPAPHTVRFMHDEAHLLPKVLDAAGIATAVLLGHSDGGSIALIAAAEFPERVQALILEAPYVFVEEVSLLSIERMQRLYAGADLRERLGRYHANVDTAFHGWNDVWLDPAFRGWNLEEYLPRISCPVLLIQGEDDEYGTIAQVDAIARQVSGTVERLVLPACGHSPHRDQPDRVLAAIERFVER